MNAISISTTTILLHRIKPRMWVESRANIGRFAYYCHWLGVWHDKYLEYLKKEFLYSSEFEDEVALFDAAARTGEIGTKEKNYYLDKEDKTKGGLQLHRLREKRVYALRMYRSRTSNCSYALQISFSTT